MVGATEYFTISVITATAYALCSRDGKQARSTTLHSKSVVRVGQVFSVDTGFALLRSIVVLTEWLREWRDDCAVRNVSEDGDPHGKSLFVPQCRRDGLLS